MTQSYREKVKQNKFKKLMDEAGLDLKKNKFSVDRHSIKRDLEQAVKDVTEVYPGVIEFTHYDGEFTITIDDTKKQGLLDSVYSQIAVLSAKYDVCLDYYHNIREAKNKIFIKVK